MSETIADVIGQGTYGCVHKPSLKCKNNSTINYTNKVSKILRKSDAKKEVGEYIKVERADKEGEFYLGKPEPCEFDEKNVRNLRAIQKCKIGSDVLSRLNSYNLLVMEDGGINIDDYAKKMKSWAISEMSTEHCEKFLLESLRLFAGLGAFEKHELVHHDLKPQNIVFNERTGRLNFIDFGLMESRKKLINDAKKSSYDWSIFHWSYPWELEVLNKKRFDLLFASSKQREDVIRHFFASYKLDNSEIKKQAGTFGYFVFDASSPDYGKNWSEFLSEYESTIIEDIPDMGYEEFLNKSIRTVDVFGLGIAMNFWLIHAKRFLDDDMYSLLSQIFQRMICARLSDRFTVEQCLEYYENFLVDSGLLEKYDKKIDDHIVVDYDAPKKVMGKVKPPKAIKPDAAFVNADPGPVGLIEQKSCPEGKERNSKTGRCIKIKTSIKECPEGKVLNSKTGRCIKNKTEKKCPDGKVLNSKTGRCIKNKTEKRCPEGKVINSKTGRCIKIKP
jgi:serine/threonine protein kinase